MGASASVLGGSRSSGRVLLKAVRSGDLSKVEAVLASSPGAAAYCTLEGLSCLHVAAAARRSDLLAQLILALRAAHAHRPSKASRRSLIGKINQKNVHGQTPLMLACRAGAADCVRLLLEAGADATLFDDLQQQSALHYAAAYGWAEVVDALLEDESVVTTPDGRRQPLREALIPDSQGHHRYIDGREGNGLAPLHLAATHGHLAAVKALLKWGASLTVRCNSDYVMGQGDRWAPQSTPLHYAAAGDRARVVLAILQAAAEWQRDDPQAPDIRLLQDFRGQRPYDVAASQGHRSLLWALSPRVPLAALLASAPAVTPAVPPLATLAAAALRKSLVLRLEELREMGEEARNNRHVSSCSAAALGRTSLLDAGAAVHVGGPQQTSVVTLHGSAADGSEHVTAIKPAAFAALARRSSHAAAASSECPSPGAGQSLHLRAHAIYTGKQHRHTRHLSDSGVGSSLHTFQAPSLATAAAAGSVGGSVHCGVGSSAAPFAARQPLPPSASPAGGPGDPAAVAASVANCGTAASVASAAGCPICLDCRLEAAILPCRHGLCLECAQHLSSDDCPAGAATAPLCPLCRGVIGGFDGL